MARRPSSASRSCPPNAGPPERRCSPWTSTRCWRRWSSRMPASTPGRVNGLLTHGIAESAMFAPATLCEYLGLPMDFGERVDLGGATSAGMVWRAAAAVELGICDAVLCRGARVGRGAAVRTRSGKTAPSAPNWYVASSNNVRVAAGRVRDPLWQRGSERALRADRPALRGAVRLRPGRGSAKIAVDQRTNACAHSGRGFLRPPRSPSTTCWPAR